MATTQELITAYLCQSCDTITDTPDETLYECNNCGLRFKRGDDDGATQRCPECNRFAAKVADQSCPNCDDGELEEVSAFSCPTCDSLHQKDEPTCRTTEYDTAPTPNPGITLSPTGRSFHNLPVQLPAGLYIHDAQTRMDDRELHTGGMMLRLSTWTIRSTNSEVDWEIIIEEKESYLLHTVTCTRCNVTTEHFDLRDAAEYVATNHHLHEHSANP